MGQAREHLEEMMRQVMHFKEKHEMGFEQKSMLGSLEYNINRLAVSFLGEALTWKIEKKND